VNTTITTLEAYFKSTSEKAGNSAFDAKTVELAAAKVSKTTIGGKIKAAGDK
jgi:hypothetical protein